jgi:branched-chain amino acid transport system ATP-binding protein
MLELRDVEVRYGTTPAVRGVDLRVNHGEAVGLIGANGAGKTSTLKAITGVLPVYRGVVELEERPLVGLSPEAIVRRGVALVPEGRRIFAGLSVEENLRLAAAVDPKGSEERIEEAFEWFPGLRQYRTKTAGQLSGGEQQQLAVARALMTKPRLLLLDEPSLGLAPLIVEAVFHLLAELRRTGLTILLVEQNARKTIRFCDRTYVMTTGRISFEGTSESFASVGRRALEGAYFG